MCLSIVFLLVLVASIALSWDLSSYNISSSYYVSSVSIFGNRAFLALPRSSCYNNVTNPTLVEASWYNEKPPYPGIVPFFLESQVWDECSHLQDVISLDMEPLRSRLWVLDNGQRNCEPKIVIYNLFQKHNYSLEAPNRDKFNSLLVDTDLKLNGAKGYVGVDGASYMWAFSLNEFKWWKINVESTTLYPISTKFLAFSRKDANLFMTGGPERGIFGLDLTLIRKEFENDEENVTVSFLGEKLGNSSGLVADFKDGLTYYMPRDYVAVRWDMRNPSEAEYYNVLAQSYELMPFVAQLFTGPQNGIWALSNPGDPNECPKDSPLLSNRLVKLLKYNIFI